MRRIAGRLRVGVVVPGWSGPGADVAMPALQDLLWRVARDVEVRLVAVRHPRLRMPYRDAGGLAVVPLGFGTRAGLVGRAVVGTTGLRTLRHLHHDRPFDLLHGFWADEPGAIAVAAAGTLGLPVAVSLMGGELVALSAIGYGAALGRGGRWGASIALREADVVTVGSRWLERDLMSRRPDVAVRWMPLGVDLTRFAPGLSGAVRMDRSPVVLSVGSLTEVKDPVLLLRAFARVRTADARLVVAGDGPMRAGLERLATNLGILARVQFLGAIPRVALPDVYRGADVLAVTSLHEAQSMVAVEAAASGLPVVGTSVGVLPELAAAGGGLVMAGREPAAIAEGLDAALKAATHDRLGAGARAYAAASWDLDAAAGRLADTWHDLAKGMSSASSDARPG